MNFLMCHIAKANQFPYVSFGNIRKGSYWAFSALLECAQHCCAAAALPNGRRERAVAAGHSSRHRKRL